MTELSATAAVEAMRNGDIKAEDYARAVLDKAQKLDGLNAFRILSGETVLEAARAADKARASGASLGMLHALPIPVKDSVNTKGLVTPTARVPCETSSRRMMQRC
jgi:indoleacetamide hydrolase